MNLGTVLIEMILALFFSSGLNDYVKDGRFINLFIATISAIGILTIFVECLKGV